MRTIIMMWVAPSAILISAALLVALAQGAGGPEAQSGPSIDTRELTEKAAGPLPLQFYDVI